MESVDALADHGQCLVTSGRQFGTALDLAIVEGFASMGAERPRWEMPGPEFRSWRADADDWLDAAFCSFWWD